MHRHLIDVQKMSLVRDTEIRKLRPAELYTLGQILNISDSWKKLMAAVPKDGCENIPRFNSEHFTLIENAVQRQRRNAAEIFLDEWGTMGRKRPTLGTLLDLLVQAELFRAADYVAVDLLKEELPKRPECGPAAAVDISDETIIRLLKEQADLCSNTFDESSVILGTSLEHNVDKITYFSERSLDAVESNDANMQSTKLASVNHGLGTKGSNASEYSGINQEVTEHTPVSDLMKFSSAELPNLSALRLHDSHQSFLPRNTAESKPNSENNMPIFVQNFVSPIQMYDKREMLSAELPAVLNDIRQTGNIQNYEIRTEELPACLNSQFMTNNSALSDGTSSNNSSSISDSSNNSLSHENDEQILAINSAELPQCVIELRQDLSESNTKKTIKTNECLTTNYGSGLQSQELPIMVLEYNKNS